MIELACGVLGVLELWSCQELISMSICLKSNDRTMAANLPLSGHPCMKPSHCWRCHSVCAFKYVPSCHNRTKIEPPCCKPSTEMDLSWDLPVDWPSSRLSKSWSKPWPIKRKPRLFVRVVVKTSSKWRQLFVRTKNRRAYAAALVLKSCAATQEFVIGARIRYL